jgi:hypothetical protein
VDVGDEVERAADDGSTIVAGIGDKARRRSISHSTSLSEAGRYPVSMFACWTSVRH